MADTYQDKNGVRWLLVTSSDGSQMFGTADPGSPRQYLPLQSDTPIAFTVITDPVQRRKVLEPLVAVDIEKYAAAHKADVTLTVTATRDNAAWVIIAVLALLVLTEDKR